MLSNESVYYYISVNDEMVNDGEWQIYNVLLFHSFSVSQSKKKGMWNQGLNHTNLIVLKAPICSYHSYSESGWKGDTIDRFNFWIRVQTMNFMLSFISFPIILPLFTVTSFGLLRMVVENCDCRNSIRLMKRKISIEFKLNRIDSTFNAIAAGILFYISLYSLHHGVLQSYQCECRLFLVCLFVFFLFIDEKHFIFMWCIHSHNDHIYIVNIQYTKKSTPIGEQWTMKRRYCVSVSSLWYLYALFFFLFWYGMYGMVWTSWKNAIRRWIKSEGSTIHSTTNNNNNNNEWNPEMQTLFSTHKSPQRKIIRKAPKNEERNNIMKWNETKWKEWIGKWQRETKSQRKKQHPLARPPIFYVYLKSWYICECVCVWRYWIPNTEIPIFGYKCNAISLC